MNDLARFELQERDGLCVARVVGEIDLSNAPDLEGALEAAVPNHVAGLVLDVSETTYLDSAAIRLLFSLCRRLQARRQELRVVVPEEAPIRAALVVAGVPSIVPLHGDLNEALATMATAGGPMGRRRRAEPRSPG